MMTHTPRVTIRGKVYGNVSGYSITSKAGGIFGTQIFVRHLNTAFAIKAIVKAQPPTSFDDINNLIRADAAR